MQYVVFVHGTGVRAVAYNRALDSIAKHLSEEAGFRVVACLWGDQHGARLHCGGASVPGYRAARDVRSTALEDDPEVALWERLYEDPLYELEMLALVTDPAVRFEPGKRPAGAALDSALRHLEPSGQLRDTLAAADLDGVFAAALQAIVGAEPYRLAVLAASTPDDAAALRGAVARAIVAEATIEADVNGDTPRAAVDAKLRDDLVSQLNTALGGDKRAIFKTVLGVPLTRLAARAATRYARKRRALLTDDSSLVAGDILLYQVRGENIRRCIAEAIRQCPEPAAVIAHSLGGVATVDVLCSSENDARHVSHLITVGSQAPHFYELDALSTLRPPEPLPAHFPAKWLNVYDRRDFLSFVAAGVFPGRAEDEWIDNHQPFPMSHSAYWTNDDFWKLVTPWLSRR